MATLTTKHKPYPAYKPSAIEWLGDVPAHWEVKRLKDSVTDCVGGVWGSEPNELDDLPCVRVADFDRNRLRVYMHNPTLRAIAPNDRRRRVLNPDDLLLEKSGGGDLQPVGVVMLYDHDALAVCSNFIARLRIAVEFDPVFLTFLHSALYAIRLNTRSIKQTTGIQNLDIPAYLRELVFFPPPVEQRAIAAFLDRETAKIDALASKKERLIELLQEKRTALISHTVTKGLDPNAPMKDPGVEWLEKIPAHWEVRRASRLFSIGSGTTPPSESSEYYGGDVPWVTTSELRETLVTSTEKTITAEALRNFPTLKIFPEGSIAVAMYGATIGRLGILGVPATVNQACCVFSEAKEMNAGFWFYWLQSRRHYLILLGQGGGQPNLSQKMLRSIRVPTPPLGEQAAIADFLDQETVKLDNLNAKVQKAIELLKELRTALISAAVTGQIDVREETVCT